MSQSPTDLTRGETPPNPPTRQERPEPGPGPQGPTESPAPGGRPLASDQAAAVGGPLEMGDPETVKVYSAPHCPACDATARSLSKAGVPFEKIELASLEPQERAEVVEGHRQAPVVHAPGVGVWDGHRPSRIEQLVAARADRTSAPEPAGPQ